nr:MAG TPA: hypothetical protein [Caudoviricetes sp.]
MQHKKRVNLLTHPSSFIYMAYSPYFGSSYTKLCSST